MSYNRRVEKTAGIGVSTAGGSAVRKLAATEDGFVLNEVVLQLTTKHTVDAAITVSKNGTSIATATWAQSGAAVGDDFVITLNPGVDLAPGDKLTVAIASGTTGVVNVYAVGGIVPK